VERARHRGDRGEALRSGNERRTDERIDGRAGKDGLALEAVDPASRSSFETWKSVCTAPCGKPVAAGEYRVGGSGVASSRTFLVTGDSDLKVKSGSSAAMTVGILFFTVGIGTVLVGSMVVATAGDDLDKMKTGGYAIAAGLGGIALGLPIWLTNRTRVTVTPHVGPSSAQVSLTAASF
jgi:hypothetical protein